MWEDGAGGLTALRDYDVLRHNLVFANGYSLGFADNDDGSCRYNR